MANLYNKNIGINYKGILNLDSTINTPLDTTLRSVTDGMGVASVLSLSTLQASVAATIARASGTNTDNPFLLAYTINNSGGTNTVTGLRINATETAIVGTTHNLMDLQVGGVSAFQVTKNDAYVGIYGTNATKLYFNGTNGTRPYLGTAAFQLFLDMGSYNFTISRLGTNQITFSNNGNHILYLVAGSLTQFGGTTNAFPSIKRNGTAIDFRLADDSAPCAITASTFTQTAGDFSTIISGTNFSITTSGGTIGYNGVSRFNNSLEVGTGGTSASAILQANSTTRGFLMPRMTYAQMKAISTPATGLQVYNTTDNTPQVFDGTGYQILGTSVVTGTISAGATTLSCDNGNVFNLTLVNGTPTAITLSNARPTSVIINLKQPAGGSATVTWSTTIVWAGGSAPTLTTTANFLDVITLIYDGTTWRGTATLNFAS